MRPKLCVREKNLKGFPHFCHINMEQDQKNVKEILFTRDDVLKKYLLGSLADENTMRLIEENLLFDDDFEERFSIAEEELIEEYLDEILDASEREQFTKIFLATPERKQKLSFSRNLRRVAAKHQSPVENSAKNKNLFFDWKKLFTVQKLGFAVLALIITGVSYTVWRVAVYESDTEKGLAQMRIAYRGQRPTESRTTADFEYAPLPNIRGANEKTAADTKARARAERFLLDAAADEGNAESFHALGLFYLAERKFDEALPELNRAVELAPQNAGFQSDLGAVYLEKTKQAEIEEKGEDFFKNADAGLRHINKSLELNENLLEALFNKALLLQKMQLSGQSREAWMKYLEKDSASPWADEARKYLKLLEDQDNLSKDNSSVLKDFLNAYRSRDDAKAWQIISETKEFVTGLMVLQQLAEKNLEAENRNKTDEYVEMTAAMTYLGEIEKENTGDSFSADLAGYYKNTTAEQRKTLLEAQDISRQGQKMIFKPDFKNALENFKNAKKLFISAGDIWEAQVAEYQNCYSLYSTGEITESTERLFALSAFGEKKNYKWLKVLADNWIGGNQLALGEMSRALDFNRKSLELAETTSDVYNIQRNLIQLAEEYRSISNPQKALDFIYLSLMYPVVYYSFPRQRWRNLSFTMQILFSFKFYEAASAYASESVSYARDRLDDKWMRQSGLIYSGIIYGSLNKYDDAFRQLDEGLKFAGTFADEEMKRRLTARTLVSTANVQRQSGDCAAALENYGKAIEIYEKTAFEAGNYEARKGRLLCLVAQNDDEAFRGEISKVIKIFDENRKKISAEADRNIFFDNEQTVYDIAADYYYTRLNDKAQAFDYAENSRARSLLDSIAKDSSENQPLKISEIRRQIPPQTQILYYSVLQDKILIWYISGTNFSSVEKSFNYDDLKIEISDYSRHLQNRNDQENFKNAEREFYDLLIGAVEPFLVKDKTICIIADKELLQIPFASLISPHTGKYLIEDYNLLYAPSATVFITETNLAGQKPKRENETILSVGNPSFSRKNYPELVELPSAAEESKKSAEFYKSANVLTGNQAKKEIFTENLHNADVVHFAGHYIPNTKNPLLSKFLLASDDLTVQDIDKLKLPRVRLIILSACETGIEKLYRGEGVIGAARAFLAADVPLVVAASWAVESDATAQLMIKFHFYRKQKGMSSIASLRQAQIDLLSGEDANLRHPYFWAGFLPIGGYAEY